jgi:7-alpha-hydroxysteroid dehydrogenase
MSSFDAVADFRMGNHVAIVTGGAQNIGEAIARTFSGAGAKVMIADLQGDKAESTAARIKSETGNEVMGIGCNVTLQEDIDRCVRKTVAAFGGITTLVNNVGWGRAYPDPLEVSAEDMIESYKLNTLSAMRMNGRLTAPFAESRERHGDEFGVAGRLSARVRFHRLFGRQGGA